MMDLILDLLIHPIVDNVYILFVDAFLWGTHVLTIFINPYINTILPAIGMFMFFLLFTPKSKFHYKKFLKNPDKYISKCRKNKPLFYLIESLLLIYTLSIIMLFFLKVIPLFYPNNGLHFINLVKSDMNIFKAFGLFNICLVVVIIFKANVYYMLGFIKSWGDFNLKMIFWFDRKTLLS